MRFCYMYCYFLTCSVIILLTSGESSDSSSSPSSSSRKTRKGYTSMSRVPRTEESDSSPSDSSSLGSSPSDSTSYISFFSSSSSRKTCSSSPLSRKSSSSSPSSIKPSSSSPSSRKTSSSSLLSRKTSSSPSSIKPSSSSLSSTKTSTSSTSISSRKTAKGYTSNSRVPRTEESDSSSSDSSSSDSSSSDSSSCISSTKTSSLSPSSRKTRKGYTSMSRVPRTEETDSSSSDSSSPGSSSSDSSSISFFSSSSSIKPSSSSSSSIKPSASSPSSRKTSSSSPSSTSFSTTPSRRPRRTRKTRRRSTRKTRVPRRTGRKRASAIPEEVCRTPSHYGISYNGTLAELRDKVDDLLDAAKEVYFPARAIVVPHADLDLCGHIAAPLFKQVLLNEVTRVIMIGPSHYFQFQKLMLSPFQFYKSPFGKNIPIDLEVYKKLNDTNECEYMDTTQDEIEGSLEMLLLYLDRVMGTRKYKIVPLITGDLDEKQLKTLSRVLYDYMKKMDNLFIISTDFNHWGDRYNFMHINKKWGPDPINTLEKLDRKAMKSIQSMLATKFKKKFLKKYTSNICGETSLELFLHTSEIVYHKKFMMTMKFIKYEAVATGNNSWVGCGGGSMVIY